ncbi:MAG: hypothetical protein COB37_08855 [Kordiimonadales bacterium]|nr:MAG: hypothetical protein COB37_08855 [Kordiimonadales bacterium]
MLVVAVGPANAQNRLDSNQTIQLALDIYSGIQRSTLPGSVAIKIKKLLESRTYRCTRVSEYQVFYQRPNLATLKVKCSGNRTYGLTVATNGYFAVYGGDGMLAPINQRDAVVYSIAAEGDVTEITGIDLQLGKQETEARFAAGGEFDYLYLGLIVLVIAALVGGMIAVFIRQWRKKQGRKPRQRMKPMKKFKMATSSALKDQLLLESKRSAKYVHYHACGIYIAVGKRGKRRLFLSKFWAKIYAMFSLNFYEATEMQLATLDLQSVYKAVELAAERKALKEEHVAVDASSDDGF